MNRWLRLLFLTPALGISALASYAANDGEIGSSSTGSAALSVQIPSVVRAVLQPGGDSILITSNAPLHNKIVHVANGTYTPAPNDAPTSTLVAFVDHSTSPPRHHATVSSSQMPAVPLEMRAQWGARRLMGSKTLTVVVEPL